MLFNSFPFLLAFLPVTFLGGFVLFKHRRLDLALAFIVLCSLFFYGYWNLRHFWVIVLSVAVNFVIGRLISGAGSLGWRRFCLIVGIAFNLGMLGYFKYLGFFTNLLSAASGTGDFFGTVVNSALPIGISFYSFQQIAYLVDVFTKPVEPRYSLREYAFFVTFFPQLIAGPIVHHREIMPQLTFLASRVRGARYAVRYLAPGLAILIIGLGKKVLLADTFGIYADQALAANAVPDLTFFGAWGGVLAYTLQIYFDFSGYSDMAIGLAMLFGLRLPVNFFSPYQATSIIEFWRRWHMTLSRFLRDYLYIPLGGNRHGRLRRYVNLLLTMAIGGLWHGANWTFVFWGLMHGLLLAVNHLLRSVSGWRPPSWLAIPVTFVLVVLTWVAFRAESFHDMTRIYAVMFGAEGIVIPSTYETAVQALGPFAQWLGMRVGDLPNFSGMREILTIFIGIAIVMFAPSSVTLLEQSTVKRAMRSRLLAAGLGVVTTLVFLNMWVQTTTQFLYFQF